MYRLFLVLFLVVFGLGLLLVGGKLNVVKDLVLINKTDYQITLLEDDFWKEWLGGKSIKILRGNGERLSPGAIQIQVESSFEGLGHRVVSGGVVFSGYDWQLIGSSLVLRIFAKDDGDLLLVEKRLNRALISAYVTSIGSGAGPEEMESIIVDLAKRYDSYPVIKLSGK